MITQVSLVRWVCHMIYGISAASEQEMGFQPVLVKALVCKKKLQCRKQNWNDTEKIGLANAYIPYLHILYTS